MQFNDFKINVLKWSDARGILGHSNVEAQVLKAVSEIGELCDATAKGDREGFKDGVGDVIVCLINACNLNGVHMEDCFERAWNDIKDRTGYLNLNGVWVKDE